MVENTEGSQESGRRRGRRPAKSPMQFMFIESSTHGTNAKPDKAVRSFVMKSARSKKPWSTKSPSARPPPDAAATTAPASSPDPDDCEAPSHPPHPSALSSRSSSTFSARSRSQPASLSSPRTPPGHGSLCDMVGNGTVPSFTDEFDCLPIPTDARMRKLLHNFVNVYSAALIPLDQHQASKTSTTNWLSKGMLAGTGAPFIYAVLASSTLSQEALASTPSKDVLLYKTKAIGEINALLSDPRKGIDDNNIAAVFMLMCLEEGQLALHQKEEDAIQGALQSKWHLGGLKTMIQHRGGLAALNSNQCLQTFILMHSVAHAVTTFERPYTTLVDASGQIQQYDLPSFRSRPASARILRSFQPLKLDQALFQIISDAVIFVGDLTAWREDQKYFLDPVALQKHMCLLMYRLFDWYKQGEEDSTLEREPVDQSICLSLLIFLVMANDHRYQLVAQVAAHKLKSALEKCLLFRWVKATDLLLWALTIGALATHGTEHFGFFKQYCSLALANQGYHELTNAEEILDRLRKCIWMPNLDKQVRRLWTQMGFCNGEEVVETIEESRYSSPDQFSREGVVGGLTTDRFFGKRSESR